MNGKLFLVLLAVAIVGLSMYASITTITVYDKLLVTYFITNIFTGYSCNQIN